MLSVHLPQQEMFDNRTQTFFIFPAETIVIEHSLLSISKWEAKWHKPYISATEKTRAETVDYVRCMLITKNFNIERLEWIPDAQLLQIQDYLEDSMTATWFKDTTRAKKSGQAITSELIYSWMVAAQIPFDPAEKWHLNRLLVLIRICSENANPKKMSRKDALNQQRALNMARRAKHK